MENIGDIFNKRWIKKVIALTLVFVMIFTFYPMAIYASVFKSSESIEEITKEQNKKQETMLEAPTNIASVETRGKIIAEDLSKRTLNEKHFMLDDGSILAAMYPENIHYEKDGKLEEIDNTLEERTTKEGVRYQNKSNSFQVDFAKNTKEENLVSLESKGYTINWTMESKKETTKDTYIKEQNKSQIEDISEEKESIDLEDIQNENQKETIVQETTKEEKPPIVIQNKEVNHIEAKVIEKEEPLLNNKETGEEKLNQTKMSSAICYENILNNIDLQYDVRSEYIKESIIINNKAGIQEEFIFRFNIGELKAELLENKEIVIYKETKEEFIFKIESPYMFDDNNEYSIEIDITLEQDEITKEYIVTIIPNKEWLEDENRVYPVTIDPTVSTSLYFQDIKDTYIYNGDGDNYVKHRAHIIRIGSNDRSGVNSSPVRGLIKFTLPQLNSGDQVVWANLNICSYPKTTEWTPPTRQIQMDVHKMTSDWVDETAKWNDLNNAYDSRVEDYALYQFDYNEQYKFYDFNITSIAKEWYTTGNNYGLMLKEHTENYNYPGSDAYFISANTHTAYYNGRPMATIVYRNQTGLEDYLSYHEQSVGRAGTVYTNDYNGNLTLLHSDLSTSGCRMPASISHVFNTNDNNIDLGFGNGFRLNIYQTLVQYMPDNVEYMRYIDEDGTRHYFKRRLGTQYYDDEDGMNMTLLLSNGNNTFTIEDKYGNKKEFTRHRSGLNLWQLTKVEDNEGNYITITLGYTSSNEIYIQEVTDGAGDKLFLSYLDNRLESIEDPSGRKISYTYNLDGNLTQITYPDDLKAYYTYDNNKLTSVKNIDNSKIEYEYYQERTNRVKKISEYSTLNEIGNTLDIAYNTNITSFTTNLGYKNYVSFNNWGQKISVTDHGVGNIDIDNSYGKSYDYGESNTGGYNKLTLESKLTKPINNLLFNTGAEDPTNTSWNFGQWGTVSGNGMITSEEFYSGNKSIKLESQYEQGAAPMYSQAINAKKGETYTLSAKVKTTISGNAMEGALLGLYYLNASGTIKLILSNEIKSTNSTWERLSVTVDYPLDATSSLYACVILSNAKGRAYFDELQLEKGEIVNSYNLMENGSFDDIYKTWTIVNYVNDGVINSSGNNMLIFNGDVNTKKYIYKPIYISGKKGDSFELSAFVNLNGVPCDTGERVAGMCVNFIGANGQSQWEGPGFNADSTGWQYVSDKIIADFDYDYLVFYISYYYNANQMYVDNIGIFKDETGSSYSYDDNGNVVSTSNLVNEKSNFTYDGNSNLINAINPKGGSFTYEYDNVNQHRLTKVISSVGVDYNFTYNNYGQNTQLKIQGAGEEYIESKVNYTNDGKYVLSNEDESGNITTYETNELTGTISKVIDSNNQETHYIYNNIDRLENISKQVGNQTYENTYTYEKDRIETIIHNGFNYSFLYDSFGNPTITKVRKSSIDHK